MKKIALLLLVATLFTGCNFNKEGEDTTPGVSFPKMGIYFCPQKDYDRTYVLDSDVFDAAEKCDSWKTDFWKDTAPNAYKDCLERKKLFVERFQLGTCTPILKKTHNIGKSGCLFSYAVEYKKITKYSCFGPEIPKVIEEIKQKYETNN